MYDVHYRGGVSLCGIATLGKRAATPNERSMIMFFDSPEVRSWKKHVRQEKARRKIRHIKWQNEIADRYARLRNNHHSNNQALDIILEGYHITDEDLKFLLRCKKVYLVDRPSIKSK